MKTDKAYQKIRKSWGSLNPCTKVIRSKKEYNRKDKTWMKD